jgi:two-component system NtrC family sensor kinase
MQENTAFADLKQEEKISLDPMKKLLELIDEARLQIGGVDHEYNPEKLEALIVERTCALFNVEACSLFLLGRIGNSEKEAIFRSSCSKYQEWDYRVFLESENGSIVETCIQEKRTLHLDDFTQNPPNSQIDIPLGVEAKPLEMTDMICVPLLAKDSSLGALQIVNKREGKFSAFDQELLALEASLLANMFYNTRLIQQLQIANAELETKRWQLSHSQSTLRALFDSMPASIYIINRKFQLVAVNLARAQKGGAQKSDDIIPMIGKWCYEALMHRDSPCPNCRVLETLFEGRSTNRTERRWETEEEPTEWEISSYPILDESGQAMQAILLEQNVTEKRQMEATLAQSEKLAAVGQLAAGVAHEINNPLTAIIANSQLLQQEVISRTDIEHKEDMEESLDLILQAGARAIQVVRNLLNFARKERYELITTDINENIRQALSLLHHEIVGRSVDVDFEEGNVPPIPASPNHLQGVWLNLMVNAMDSFENGQGSIHIQTLQSGNSILVKVADNGKGIPAERMSRIFEPFYTTKAPNRGTGLGLSVCHRTIKQHGGHILVDSQIDIGTEFTIVLPITSSN